MGRRRGPWDSLSDIISNIEDLEDTNVKATFFETINSGLSGTLTPPTGGTIDLDEFGGGADALVSKMSGGLPTYEIAEEADTTPITATLNTAGEWTLSGTPSAYPVAIVYAYTVAFGDFENTSTLVELQFTVAGLADHGGLSGLGDDDHTQYLLADGTRALAGAWDMGNQALTNVNIDSGDIAAGVALNITDSGSYFDTDTVEASLQQLGQANLIGLKTGFEDASAVALSSDAGTPPTITLTFTGTVYWWSDGIRYSGSGSDNLQISDTSGSHFIYYDGDTLTEAVNPSHATIDTLIQNKGLVAWVYWNTNTNVTPILGNELHGLVMSGATHHWLHDVMGTRYDRGGTLSGYTLATASDAALSFDLTDISFYDEDIEHLVTDGSAANQYEQVLTGDAEIPVLYRDDVTGHWIEQAASTLPYISAAGGSNRLAFNNNDLDSTWSQVEVDNAKFMNMWLVVTNDWQYPVKMIQGTTQYASESAARNGIESELATFTDLPAAETAFLYIFHMKTGTGTGGTKKATIEGITDLRFSSISGTSGGVAATDHGGLSGLGDDDHPQYVKHDLADAANDFLVASGADTFARKTLAETGAILEADLDHGNIQGLADDDHTQYTRHNLSTAGNDFLVGSGSNTWIKKTLAEAGAILEADLDHGNIQGLADDDHTQYFLADGTRAMTGNITMPDAGKHIWDAAPASDDTCSGVITSETVDTNSVGIGAVLVMASDGNWDEADADAVATCGNLGLAVESGTGTKNVLRKGWIHLAGHGFTIGAQLFVSTTQGIMTNTQPDGDTDIVQVCGYAEDANTIYFNPSSDHLEVSV